MTASHVERETCPGTSRAGGAALQLSHKVEDPIDAYCAYCGYRVDADNRGILLPHDRVKPKVSYPHA